MRWVVPGKGATQPSGPPGEQDSARRRGATRPTDPQGLR